MLGVAVRGVNQDFNTIAATEAVPALLILLIVAGGVAVALARKREDRSAFEWFVGFATLAVIFAVTLFRGEVSLGFSPRRVTDWSGSDLNSLSRDPLGSSQFLLNVALFVPAGAVWTWMTKRAGRTLVALVGGSFLVECLQAITGAGGNDLVDLVANSFGALLGVGFALIVLQVGGHRVRDMTRARKLQLLSGGVVVAVLITVGWFGGAARRQNSVRTAVEARFEDTDLVYIQEQLSADSESVYRAVEGVRADGGGTDTRYELRYPATFFGLHRCVFVTWTKDGSEIRNASGDDCTRFLG